MDTEGSYTCLCHRGFRASVDQTLCMGESPLLPLFADQEAKGVGGALIYTSGVEMVLLFILSLKTLRK